MLHEFFYTFLLITCLSFVVMYYLYTLPPVSPACWKPDSGLTLEEATEIFIAYRREVRLWRKLQLEKEDVKLEEDCITSDDKDVVSIEESEEKREYVEEEIRQLEDDLVLDETTNLTFFEDVDIQPENLQQQSLSGNYFHNKENDRQEIDRVLDDIYALFNIIKLKMIWKQYHQYLKFMRLLPNKKKEKDDVFFLSYKPP